jgi:HptB-dependent secretion and biofilm anti anti-sigma factor
MSLAVKREPEHNRVLISMPKRFEFEMHKEFRLAYEDGRAPVREYVLDMGATEYCDSAALGMLLQLHEHAGKRPERVRLLHVNDSLRTILEVAKLDGLFTLA